MANNTFVDPTAHETGTMPAPVSSSYCVPYVTKLIIDHKMWPLLVSKSKFTIHDEGGTLLFNVNGKYRLSLTDPILRDPSGKALVFMKRNSKTRRWEAYCEEDDSESSWLLTTGKTSFCEVFLPANKSSTPDFTLKHIKGKWCKYKYAVLYGERVIAEANVECNTLTGKLQYDVTVEPEVDHAFISSLIVMLDFAKDRSVAWFLRIALMLTLVNHLVIVPIQRIFKEISLSAYRPYPRG